MSSYGSYLGLLQIEFTQFTRDLPRGLAVVMAIVAMSNGALGRTYTPLLQSFCWIATCPRISKAAQFGWMLATIRFWDAISYVTIANIVFVGICLRNPQVGS